MVIGDKPIYSWARVDIHGHLDQQQDRLLIRLQRIYNFGLLHAILSTVLDIIGLYYPLLYYVYVPLSDITLFKNSAPTHQVKLCFMHAWYTTSVGKQPLHAFKLACGLPFHAEMSSTMYLRGSGWARSVSTCTVHLFSSCICTPPTWGCVREIQT